jgi:hypothetical protein
MAMKKKVIIGMLLIIVAMFHYAALRKGEASETSKPRVQLALLLDTSNSMDGLVEQAKSQLWRIVNQFATATGANGQKPQVEVALFHYGTPTLGAETGYIRRLLPLTTDLDRVSEELFALKTNGGEEYCGAVIQAAVNQLQWNHGKNDYRAIFIAGNEPFTQGNVDFHVSCKAAISAGIIVNTIFCGANSEGMSTHWKEGADLADGAYFSIDHNQKVVTIATPFDKELAELGGKLNKTYVAYGTNGKAGQMNQLAQDANAININSSVAISRAVTKASSNYVNDTWDLVDAVNARKIDLAKAKDEDLPAELKNKSEKERQAYVEEKKKEREDVQKKIGELNRKRDAHIAAEQKKAPAGAAASMLDTAIINAIRSQATRANFQFKE